MAGVFSFFFSPFFFSTEVEVTPELSSETHLISV